MHVLVVTCAHRGDDARIVHRQASSLLATGWRVTLVAPEVEDRASDPVGLERITVPRAVGRRRVAAWRAVSSAVKGQSGVDLVLLHDPELVPLLARRRASTPVVWDVHEDFVASIADRSYIPGPLRGITRRVVRAVERLAGGRCHILAAEESYTAHLGDVPVVPNSTWVPRQVPPPDIDGKPRVVYVGRISAARGVDDMIGVGRLLGDRADLVLIGAADPDVEARLRAAVAAGHVIWLGPLPNPEALGRVRGALAGLSLLHDEPNYRHSRPTKLIEYLAQGVPVITTPLPVASDLVRASGAGEVVGFGDVAAVVGAIDRLDPERRRSLGAAGHAHVFEHHNWHRDGAHFVELLERWAVAGRSTDDGRKRRERTYHDDRFAGGPRTPTAKFYAVDRGKEEYRAAVRAAAGPKRRVLEFGCGTGSLALAMAEAGAEVTGIDISPVAIERARARARRRGVEVEFLEMDAEELRFERDTFDLVCGSAILHHLDLAIAFAEISRVLRPDGTAVFLEPLGHNPLINAYRWFTPGLRTDDEHPLRIQDIEFAGRSFDHVSAQSFDLFALAAVPVGERTPAVRAVQGLHRLDAAVFARSALARRWAWMTLLTLAGPVER